MLPGPRTRRHGSVCGLAETWNMASSSTRQPNATGKSPKQNLDTFYPSSASSTCSKDSAHAASALDGSSAAVVEGRLRPLQPNILIDLYYVCRCRDPSVDMNSVPQIVGVPEPVKCKSVAKIRLVNRPCDCAQKDSTKRLQAVRTYALQTTKRTPMCYIHCKPQLASYTATSTSPRLATAGLLRTDSHRKQI